MNTSISVSCCSYECVREESWADFVVHFLQDMQDVTVVRADLTGKPCALSKGTSCGSSPVLAVAARALLSTAGAVHVAQVARKRPSRPCTQHTPCIVNRAQLNELCVFVQPKPTGTYM